MMIDPSISARDRAQLLENLGLNRPLYIQYWQWLKEVLKGNLGYSFVSGQPVLSAISSRMIPTLLLSISTLVISLFLAIPLGLISAFYRGKWVDRIITQLSLLGLAMPTFWLGMLFVIFLSLKFSLFPTSGFLSPDYIDAPFGIRLINILHHLALPLLTMVVGSLAAIIRYERFYAIGELMKGYVQAGRARGFSTAYILIFMVLKNTALPLITLLGLELPGLVGGAFVVEYIFAWPGMGQLGVSAIFARDYPMIMGILLITSTLMLLGTILADMSYRFADPRIRLK